MDTTKKSTEDSIHSIYEEKKGNNGSDPLTSATHKNLKDFFLSKEDLPTTGLNDNSQNESIKNSEEKT